jgi:hypothetical protein
VNMPAKVLSAITPSKFSTMISELATGLRSRRFAHELIKSRRKVYPLPLLAVLVFHQAGCDSH